MLCSFQDHLGFPNASILIRDFGCSERITSPADCCDIQRYLWSQIPVFLFICSGCANSLQLCPTLCNPTDCVARQASLSMGFSRQEYWSGLPFPYPGDLPDPGIEPMSLSSPAVAGRFFTAGPSHLNCPSWPDYPGASSKQMLWRGTEQAWCGMLSVRRSSRGPWTFAFLNLRLWPLPLGIVPSRSLFPVPSIPFSFCFVRTLYKAFSLDRLSSQA